MATQILAAGSGAANSADIVIATTTTVGLKGANAAAEVAIKLKDDAGGYNVVGELSIEEAVKVIVGPGTYRFSRVAGTCGVFSG